MKIRKWLPLLLVLLAVCLSSCDGREKDAFETKKGEGEVADTSVGNPSEQESDSDGSNDGSDTTGSPNGEVWTPFV